MSEELLESNWSERVSNDPKHRPQVLDRPSTTVRKDWCRRPQEAHIADGRKYRRLSVEEIAAIQGFPFEWINVEGISDKDRIAVLGNAVPPPLSSAIAKVLDKEIGFENKTLLEICAGIGGLSYGFDFLRPIAKIELWDIAAKVLKTNKPWPETCVVEGFAQDYDYSAVCGQIGLLCGGPPCQPWSQAGKQKGAEDPRDVMGFTPTAIAACEPEVFLFENVPGLFTANEHKAYVSDLLKRMGNPKEGLRYGVATIILNAADFGVPQIRKRVIILGIKNKSNTFANKILTLIQKSSTHHDPSKPSVGKLPWVTLRQAFKDIPVTEPWKKWKVTDETLRRLELTDTDEILFDDNDSIADLSDKEKSNDTITVNKGIKIEQKSYTEIAPEYTHIELVWPGKNQNIVYKGSSWKFVEKTEDSIKRALLFSERIENGQNKGYVIKGDYISSLEALNAYASSQVKTVYFDAPRLSAFENESVGGYVVSTWLSIVREVAANAHRLLKNNGFFILQTDEEMSHYGRQVLDEVFGRTHHVTTFAWQKKYAPQNDKTKNNPTDVFDYIIVYSKCSIEDLPKIGILQEPDNIIDDGDWRGCYTAGHKGAKSGSEATKFHVNAPPYRWEIIDSKLPKGRYWFDNITGVLWFESVEEVGDFWLDIKVSDSKNLTTEKRVCFSVREPNSFNEHFEIPKRIWWLDKNDNDIKPDGEISIISTGIEEAILGEPYSLILKAEGGKPFTMQNSAPGTNRYWEFAFSTLVEAIATTTASFGKKGSSLPSRKTFYDRANAKKRSAVMNWLPWQDYGKSEDATRHVKSLNNAGITVGEMVFTAKPQKLIYHLLTLFAPDEKDMVVSLGDLNGAVSSVAMKFNRRFIHITGSSNKDLEMWNNTASRRIIAVINGKDSGEIEKDDEFPIEYNVSKGSVDVLKVSNRELKWNKKTGALIISETGESIKDFYAGLAGGYSDGNKPGHYYGLNGKHIIVLESEDILDTSMMSYYSSKYFDEKIVLISERTEIDKNMRIPNNISIIHAPFDFIGRY